MLQRQVAIDLGTTQTVLAEFHQGIVKTIPTVVAVDPEERVVIATGDDAKALLDHEHGLIQGLRPLSHGKVDDFQLTKIYIETLVQPYVTWRLVEPEVYLTVPSMLTDVEERAFIQVTQTAGAKSVKLLESGFAASLGIEGKLSDRSRLILDFGGGLTDLSLVVGKHVVRHDSMSLGGLDLDWRIQREVKRGHGLAIGMEMARMLKEKLLSATNENTQMTMMARGVDLASGLPKEIVLTGFDIFSYVHKEIEYIERQLVTFLGTLPPYAGGDIKKQGLMLIGGGAHMADLDKRLNRRTGLSVQIPPEPTLAVARGLSEAMKTPEVFYEYRPKGRVRGVGHEVE